MNILFIQMGAGVLLVGILMFLFERRNRLKKGSENQDEPIPNRRPFFRINSLGIIFLGVVLLIIGIFDIQ